MDEHSLFDLWAPPESTWSKWAKVAPLSQGLSGVEAEADEKLDANPRWQFPDFDPHCALLIDLPGGTGVAFAANGARIGYRPVVMVNALPQPGRTSKYAVDVLSTVAMMMRAAKLIEQHQPGPDAPPAFVVDALRFGRMSQIETGVFDNRSALFRSDFPSARKLREAGIERLLVIRDEDPALEADLANVLNGWIDDGLEIAFRTPEGESLTPALRHRWSRIHAWWIRVCVALFFHRKESGDFGEIIRRTSGG